MRALGAAAGLSDFGPTPLLTARGTITRASPRHQPPQTQNSAKRYAKTEI